MVRLRELRKEQKISQEKLASDLGVGRSTLSMWEIGASQPDNDLLKVLADYFSVSTDYLLGRTDDRTISKEQNLKSSNNVNLDELEFALFGEVKDLTEEQKKDILNFARFIKSQQGK